MTANFIGIGAVKVTSQVTWTCDVSAEILNRLCIPNESAGINVKYDNLTFRNVFLFIVSILGNYNYSFFPKEFPAF